MLKIALIRHAMTDGNTKGKFIGQTDEPLLPSELELMKTIQVPPVEVVFCSPLKRCVDTAKLLYSERKLVKIPGFKECNFGEFEGKTYQELQKDATYQKWIDKNLNGKFPGGESTMEFNERIQKAFGEIIYLSMRMKLNDIAVVAHRGTIAFIMEKYAFPKLAYKDCMVDNLGGFIVRTDPEAFCNGEKELIVDGRIVRGE